MKSLSSHAIDDRPPRSGVRLSATVLGLWLGLSTVLSAPAPKAVLSTPLGSYESNSYANGVQVVGKIAYFAGGEDGLQILNVADPAHVVALGTVDTPGNAYAVQVVGNRAYVADFEGGLQIIDVSNPASPTRLGEYAPGFWVGDSKIDGNIAYIACFEGGVHIVDVSDPANPVKLGEYLRADDPDGTSANRITMVGKTAYIAYTHLEIVDMSDPANPKRVSGWNNAYVAGVDVVGDLAYLAAVDDGLIVLNIKDPANPVRITRIPAAGGAISVKVVGNLAYTESGVVDVSDPVSPVRLGTFPVGPFADPQYQVVGDVVYLPNGVNTLQILKLRFGSLQTLNWTGPTDRVIPEKTTAGMDVSSSSGLPVTLEVVAGPATLAGTQLTVNGPGKIVVKASQAGNEDVLPIEETRLINQRYAQLTDLGAYGFSTNVYAVTVVGSRAYVANDAGGSHILDISNPGKPVLLGSLESTNQVLEIDVVGNHAYIADGAAGFKVADVSDPAHPVVLSQMDAGTAITVRVYGNLAYVGDLTGRKFLVVDVSDPAQPKLVGTIPVDGQTRLSKLVGTRVYLSAGFGGVVIYDVANPASPVKVAALNLNSQVRSLDVVGNLLYVPTYSDGRLVVYDIADPVNPVKLGAVELGGSPRRVQVVGNDAYVVTESDGLQVVDVSDPAHMVVMARIPTGGYARDIQVVGSLAYVADQNAGYRVFRHDATGFRPALDAAVPAGLRAGTSVPLSGASTSGTVPTFDVVSGAARIEGGRLVATGLGLITVRASAEAANGFLPATRDFVVTAGMPDLSLRRSAAGLEAAWPAGLGNVRLEQNGLVIGAGGSWVTSGATVTESAGESRAAVDASGGGGLLRLATDFPGVPEPLDPAGWNRDVVLENGPSPVAQPFDSEGGAWFEDGLDGYFNGLPGNRQIQNQLDPTVPYRLQPYAGNNVLMLEDSAPTASLSFANPVACSKLYVLSASTREYAAAGNVVIVYADGSKSAPKPFVAHAWYGFGFDGRPIPSVFPRIGSSHTSSGLNYARGELGYSMYHDEIDLGSGPDAGKAIARLEFTKGSQELGSSTGIFAVSGIRVPVRP